MIKNGIKNEINEIAELLQTGHGDAARLQLRKLLKNKVPKEHLLKASELARRTGLYSLALRLLNPLIRPSGKTAHQASDEEKAEYAASLTFVGASEEAFTILEKLNSDKLPQVQLFEAYSHIAQWDYAKAIPSLQKYIKSEKVSSYEILVGKINLAAALVYERLSEQAEKILTDLLESTGKGKFPLLYGFSLELSAQNYLWNQKYEKAEVTLKKARLALTSNQGLNEFFIRKWEAFHHCLKQAKQKNSISEVTKIRKEAWERGHWESVRDCDRFTAVFKKDLSLLHHVYYGTPFDSFRNRLLRDYGKVEIKPNYIWYPQENKKTTRVLDVLSGEELHRPHQFKAGQLVHKMLFVLTADFYQPTRMALLYHKLYPDDFFNPYSSPHRIHEIVRRLKSWFKTEKFPLTVEEKLSYYKLKPTGDCGLKVTIDKQVISKNDLLSNKLKNICEGKLFTAAEASDCLNIPLRTAQRMLLELCKQGKINRNGKGLAIRYGF